MTPKRSTPAPQSSSDGETLPDPTAGGSYVDEGSGPVLVLDSQTVPAEIVHRARVLMQKDKALDQATAIVQILAADKKEN